MGKIKAIQMMDRNVCFKEILRNLFSKYQQIFLCLASCSNYHLEFFTFVYGSGPLRVKRRLLGLSLHTLLVATE